MMPYKNRLAPLSLKWNPFGQGIPTASFRRTPPIEHFCCRVQNLAREGGFALVTGEPGLGKSVTMRILAQHLEAMPDIGVGVLSRPHSSMSDFYREMGDLFDVQLSPHNRWAGTKALRQRWCDHIESVLFRPLLLVDEGQEVKNVVLNELRLLASAELDSRSLLTVVLAGDRRLSEKFRAPELVSLGSRIRARLLLEALDPKELLAYLKHVVEEAGNPALMTEELMRTLCEHAAGNLRVLMTTADELLEAALETRAKQIDEKLYLELFGARAARVRGRDGRAR